MSTRQSVTVPFSTLTVYGEFEGYTMRVINRWQQFAENGLPIELMRLGNSRRSANAVLWHEHLPEIAWKIHHGAILKLDGKVAKDTQNKPWLIVTAVEFLDPSQVPAICLFPQDWVPEGRVADAEFVVNAIKEIQSKAMRTFIKEIFMNASQALGLLNAQASKKHHHSFLGGLLAHVAEMLREGLALPEYACIGIKRDIFTTLVLLHDLGKVVTMAGEEHSQRGQLQAHEFAVLEMIAEPLKSLAFRSPDDANIIRGFFKPAAWFPRNNYAVYEDVRALDRKSANTQKKMSWLEQPSIATLEIAY